MITLKEVRAVLHAHKDTWLVGTHQGNDGNQGNTLEKLLGVEENNLRLPDLGDIELKTRKAETGSLITLFHKEPKPSRSIPKLLQCLGWKHKEAGVRYGEDEMSFRSTTYAHRYSKRGFTIDLNKERIEFIFDPEQVKCTEKDVSSSFLTYGDWLSDVESRALHYTDVLPVFWERKDFEAYCLTKLNQTLMCTLKTRKIGGVDHFKVVDAIIMSGFLSERLERLFDGGFVAIDFDARTGHNHGTKLRVQKDKIGELFEFSEKIL